MSTTLADPSHIAAAREFSRFYTAKLGMTRSSVYRTQFSLAEARVLYELGAGVMRWRRSSAGPRWTAVS